MDTATKHRALFGLARAGWILLVLTIATTTVVLGLYLLDWVDAWPHVVFGAVAGAAIGWTKDSRISQIMVGATGLVLLAFALRWSETGGVPDGALPLLGMGFILFCTLSLLSRIWGRTYHLPEPSLADLDAVVSRPGMG